MQKSARPNHCFNKMLIITIFLFCIFSTINFSIASASGEEKIKSQLTQDLTTNPDGVATSIASSPQNQDSLRYLKKFKSSESINELLRKRIQDLNLNSYRNMDWEIVLKEVDDLPDGSFAQISPNFSSGNKLLVSLSITPEGLKNPAIVVEQIVHLEQIVGSRLAVAYKDNHYMKLNTSSYLSPFHWAETVVNAESGSSTAIKKLAAATLEAVIETQSYLQWLNNFSEKSSSSIGKIPFITEDKELFDQYIQSKRKSAFENYNIKSKEEKLDLVKRTNMWESQRAQFNILESQKDKLNDLVANNKRSEVKKLIESYLPWPLMEPSEKITWRIWLEAIENPDPNNTKLLFRGLDGDIIMKNPAGDPYLMSTILTKNQGSYTRRLRSLTTMRDKIAKSQFNKSPISGFKDNSSVTTIMFNHAVDPNGSPFLSSSNLYTASKFGEDALAAFKIDKRRLLLNSQGVHYFHEVEHLIPLIVFPDEIIHLEVTPKSKKNAVASTEIDFEKFKIDVEAKIGRALTESEFKTTLADTDKFIRESVAQTNNIILNQPKKSNTTTCGVNNLNNSCNCILTTINELLAP